MRVPWCSGLDASRSHSAIVFFRSLKPFMPPYSRCVSLPPAIICLLRWDHFPFVKMSEKFSISPASSHMPTCAPGANVSSYFWSSLLVEEQNTEKLCHLPRVPLWIMLRVYIQAWKNRDRWGCCKVKCDVALEWWDGSEDSGDRPRDKTFCWYPVSLLRVSVSSLTK